MASYTVTLNETVINNDLPELPRNMQARVLRAMRERLAVDPARYGERLRKSLLGLWKIRVGDYRVIYEIAARRVRVWAVSHRRDVYPEALRRWVR